MGGRSKKRGGKNGGCGEREGGEGAEVVEERSNALPMANVVRLMKRVLPPHVKISESAKQLTHNCAVEFVGFVGGEASELARSETRRTIAPEDFVRSFRNLGFDKYVDPMQTYIQGYRECQDSGFRGDRSRGPPRPAPAPAPAPAPVPAPATAAPVPVLMPPGEPITVTDEELEFLRSVIPPPPGGY